MSYDSEILLDNPLSAPRLNEVSGAVSEDISPNNRDALIFTSPSETVIPVEYGLPGPIETDSQNFAMAGGIGRLPADAALNTVNAFTWEFWFLVTDDLEGSLLLSRNASAAGIGGTSVFVSGQTLVVRLRMDSTGSTNWEVSSDNQLALGTWYYGATTRNANVLQLTLNDLVVDEITNLPTDTVTMNGAWGLGATSSGLNNGSSQGLARPAIYNTALSEARRLAHYEAGLNSLFLNGYSNVISSAILYSDIEPDPVAFPFRHNWSDNLIERISFRTNISRARKGYEENGQVRPKPRREIEISQVLRDNNERRNLRSKLTSSQNRKWFIPILEDREALTSTLASGATTIPVSTQYKDYEVNSWLELRQLNDGGQVVKSEILEINTVTPSLTTKTAAVNSYDPYLSTASPARRGFVEASITPQGHTDSVEEVGILARLIAEDEKATPNRITAWTPTITYRGYEVFDPAAWQSNDWTELRDYSVNREREDIDFEVGGFNVASDTIGASEAFSYRMLLQGRDKQAALLGWFYARAGSLHYLWVPTTQQDFSIVSAISDDLTVEGHNYFDNFAGSEFRRDLAFVYHDNTMAFRRIEGVTLDGANEVLDLEGITIPTQTNLRSLSYLRFCELEGDTLEIARITDTKARFSFRFREILSSPA